jgi:hypothetical protein
MGKRRRVYRFLVGKPEGKRPLGRPRHGWEYGVKMSGGEGVEWIDLAEYTDRGRAVVNTVMNLRVLAPRS